MNTVKNLTIIKVNINNKGFRTSICYCYRRENLRGHAAVSEGVVGVAGGGGDGA